MSSWHYTWFGQQQQQQQQQENADTGNNQNPENVGTSENSLRDSVIDGGHRVDEYGHTFVKNEEDGPAPQTSGAAEGRITDEWGYSWIKKEEEMDTGNIEDIQESTNPEPPIPTSQTSGSGAADPWYSTSYLVDTTTEEIKKEEDSEDYKNPQELRERDNSHLSSQLSGSSATLSRHSMDKSDNNLMKAEQDTKDQNPQNFEPYAYEFQSDGTAEIFWNAKNYLAICRTCQETVYPLELEKHFCMDSRHRLARDSKEYRKLDENWTLYMIEKFVFPAFYTSKQEESYRLPKNGSKPIEGLKIFAGYRCQFSDGERGSEPMLLWGFTMFDGISSPRCQFMGHRRAAIEEHCKSEHDCDATSLGTSEPWERVALQRLHPSGLKSTPWVVDAPAPTQ